ncbi:hypothetical protein JCM24511_01294 [Saitozyma sp. JCM 24511]|nr:hypothetical protein JCM24511_01294 [Saitozyma sp. JCM 24511]
MSATTSVNDEFVQRLRNACRQSIGAVSNLDGAQLQRSLRTQMEPLHAVFRPQLSLDGMPDAEAVVTLMKDSRPSMAEIIEDLHINSAFAIPDGCPPVEWTRLKSAIQTLREFSDKYSGTEDREDIIFQLTNPSIVVEVVSQFLDGSFEWNRGL